MDFRKLSSLYYVFSFVAYRAAAKKLETFQAFKILEISEDKLII